MLETFPYSNIKHGVENLLRKVSISNIALTNFGGKKIYSSSDSCDDTDQ